MKKHCTYLVVLTLAGILLCSEVFAQRRISQFRGRRTTFTKNQRYFSVGGSLGTANYFGDLAPRSHVASTRLAFTRPAISLTGMYRIGPQSTIRASFMWARLKADDASADPLNDVSKYRYVRNLHFRNDIKELSFEYVFDIIPHQRTFVTRPQFVPYLTAGVAVFHHNPRARVPATDAYHYDLHDAQPIENNDARYGGVSPGDWIALRPLGTEGQYVEGSGVTPYSNWQLAIPVGVGIRYRLNRYLDFAFEIGYRQTFTDYLDDVSGNYINPEAFGTGPEANLSRLMADRSKEPATASGSERDLIYIEENINQTSPYGQVPAEFGNRPYDLINGYGRAHRDNIRGKDDYDVYLTTKFQVTYIIGTNIRNAKFR